MKRFLLFILLLALLLPCTIKPTVTQAQMLPNTQVIARGGIQLCRLAGQYSASARLLTYSAKGVKHVRFGPESVFSKQIAESEQLSVLTKTMQAGNGTVSFYGSGDLEYAIGEASYTLTFTDDKNGKVAKFLISDRYDFNGIREGNSVSVLLNNIGYILQNRGTLLNYDWVAEVRIPIEE